MLSVFHTKYALLDKLPDTLYTDVVRHPHGELVPRIHAVVNWRRCLLNGKLPEQQDSKWPEPRVGRTILQRLEALQIVQFCKDEENLTDAVLKEILDGIRTAEEQLQLRPDGLVDRMAQRLKFNCNASSQMNTQDSTAKPGQDIDSPSARQQFQPEQATSRPVQELQKTVQPAQPSSAMFNAGQDNARYRLTDHFSEKMAAEWRNRLNQWKKRISVLQDFGGLPGSGWDLSLGTSVSQDWQDILHYRELVKRVPELQQVIAALGREQIKTGSDQTDSSNRLARTQQQPASTETERDECKAMETGGIIMGDELTRLLPSELAQLGHPKLKMLWYARRAERKLLTYSHCGLMPDTMQAGYATENRQAPPQASKKSGPIIICLDTSGSMHGEPEWVAKALSLEALRLAHHEKRACYVYNFGGPGQVIEHELDLTRGGLGKVQTLLQQSFHSGTDIVKPFLKALVKLQGKSWQKADMLLITDGRFPIQPKFFRKARAILSTSDCRTHGLLLGNWHSKALNELCSSIHRFNNWAALKDESPDA